MTFAKLIKVINDQFGPPFLPEGHVEARSAGKNGSRLYLRIGRRDIDIDQSGKVVGAGTSVCESNEETQ